MSDSVQARTSSEEDQSTFQGCTYWRFQKAFTSLLQNESNLFNSEAWLKLIRWVSQSHFPRWEDYRDGEMGIL